MSTVLVEFTEEERDALLELASHGMAALKEYRLEPRAVDREAVQKLRDAEPAKEAK